ncbi:[FeFe] hydrogenase H-cluster radical SAM maturase HydE [uncultured Pseudodesulfovibrio sp.]|uniref:[FeFe] hydrogenase H-cluster radical SAM maturase HydE n=1 Tax=uncultured Pseudodesulfovibrio sp. TaxID=2035858 RepID=UPI0029C72D01|nr:[FeFe] hydrogenase H-cluster radical SAM maturase HydE [uncultured Pseudodesulfovibrio sp.]
MNTLTEQEILAYLVGADDNELFARAEATKQEIFGNEVYLRAIIEFSNICDKKCHYCGLRAPNSTISRYRMDVQAIRDAAAVAAEAGAGTIVLQSGDDFGYSTQIIGELVRDIKERHDVAVTLSLGDRGLDEYEFWRDCGADRCLLKLETTNPRLYKRIRGGEDFSARLHRVQGIRDMGYEIGSGVIVDQPDSDMIATLRDILFLTQLDLDMIAIGPFIPHPHTPLGNARPGSITLSHRVTALLRILNPHANIPSTSALGAGSPKERQLALTRGCNVLMPSMTPEEHRRDYNIYPGKNAVIPTSGHSLDIARDMIRSLGLTPSSSKGPSKRSPHAHERTTQDTVEPCVRREVERGQAVAE